jgi:hypothetical protein
MRIPRLLVLMVVAGPIGCAAFRPGPREAEHVVPVRIENDLVSRADVTVRIVASDGASRLLGGAPPGRDVDLEYRERRFSSSYVLTATTGAGVVIESRSFTLFPDATVVWSLQRNHVVVGTAGGTCP